MKGIQKKKKEYGFFSEDTPFSEILSLFANVKKLFQNIYFLFFSPL